MMRVVTRILDVRDIEMNRRNIPAVYVCFIVQEFVSFFFYDNDQKFITSLTFAQINFNIVLYDK